MTPVLGAILNGGQSRRFGSDKALALMPDGQPMIAHVVARMASQCGQLAVCGRPWGGLPALEDRPRPGLGPLAGLCAALAFAKRHGHSAVLCAPCDMPDMPSGLIAALSPGPAVVEGQWLLGLWPVALAPVLHRFLEREGAVAMRRWVVETGARSVSFAPLRNINHRQDLYGKDIGAGSD